MPSAADFNTESIKMLYCGKPGTGKTGSLISELIRNPAARFFLANYDKGNIGTLVNVAKVDPKTNQPRPNAAELLSRIQYHDLQDKIQVINGVPMVTGTPTAFADLGKKLNDWGDGFGSLSTRTKDDWLIIDSNTALCEAAFRYALFKGGRLNQRPQQADYGEAMQRLQLIYEMVCDPSVICNVCIITHVRYLGDPESGTDEDGEAKGQMAMPNAIGQRLPAEMGRYFNNIIMAETVGEGPGLQRKIFTRNPGKLVLRTSNPGGVKPEYPLSTGFGDLVRDLRGTPTQPAAGVVPPSQPGTVASTTPATPPQ